MADPLKKATFIPQKPLAGNSRSGQQKRRKTRSIFGFIGAIVFLASLAGAAGAFLYERLQSSTLENRKEELAAEKADFDPELIEQLKQFDLRIEVAEQLIDDHLYPTTLLEAIEINTLRSVQLTALELKPGDETGMISFKLTGVTDSYTTLALQSEGYGETRLFVNPVFSNFSLDEFGNVVFDMTAAVPLSVLKKSPLSS